MGCPTCYETTSPEIVPVTVNQQIVQIDDSPLMFRYETFSYGDVADNRTFLLALYPYEPKSVQVFLNSGAQRYLIDFNMQGQFLVMTNALQSGDTIVVRYVSVDGALSTIPGTVGMLVASAGDSLEGFLRMDGGVGEGGSTHVWNDYPSLKNWFWADGTGVSAGVGNPADTAEPGASRRSSLLGTYDGTNFELVLLQDTSYDGTQIVPLAKFIGYGYAA
jgi:hypothetical protein